MEKLTGRNAYMEDQLLSEPQNMSPERGDGTRSSKFNFLLQEPTESPKRTKESMNQFITDLALGD